MRRAGTWVLGIALLLGAGGAAQQPAETGRAAAGYEEFFVGTWVAQTELPGLGPFRAVITYQPALGDKFLLATGRVTAGEMVIASESLIGRNPATGRVESWGFSSDGSIGITQETAAGGGVWKYEGQLFGGLNPGPARFTLARDGDGAFTLLAEVLHEGAWQQHASLRYARQAGTAEPAGAPTPLAPPNPAMAALEPLAGEWVTEGESGGRRFTNTLVFEPVLGGHFVRTDYRIGLDGAPEESHAISYIGWHAGKGQLVQYGFSPDRGVMEFAVAEGEGGAVVFRGPAPGADRRELRITYRRSGGQLEGSTEVSVEGQFRSLGASAYRRK